MGLYVVRPQHKILKNKIDLHVQWRLHILFCTYVDNAMSVQPEVEVTKDEERDFTVLVLEPERSGRKKEKKIQAFLLKGSIISLCHNYKHSNSISCNDAWNKGESLNNIKQMSNCSYMLFSNASQQ